MAKEELVGPPFSVGPTTAAWADGTAPQSSNGLHVQLDVNSIANVVGSQSSPFQTNDIVGLSDGLLLLIGENCPSVRRLSPCSRYSERSRSTFGRGSGVVVRHDLVNVGQLRLFGGGTAEIGRGIGQQRLTSKEILQHPAR